MPTDYNSLEEQLGALGKEEEVQSLGHLEHVGKRQEDLTPEEEASKEAFLKRSRQEAFIPTIEIMFNLSTQIIRINNKIVYSPNYCNIV